MSTAKKCLNLTLRRKHRVITKLLSEWSLSWGLRKEQDIIWSELLCEENLKLSHC